MFDHLRQSFMEGHFPLHLDTQKTPEGDYEVSWTAPGGERIAAVAADLAEANRRCTDQIRAGVLEGTITLAR